MTNLWYSYHTYIAPYTQHRVSQSDIALHTNIKQPIDVDCNFNGNICNRVRSKYNILSTIKSTFAGLFAK